MRGSEEKNQLNTSIQPYKLATKNGEVRFSWPVSDFQRLCEMLYSDAGKIDILVKGHNDHRRRCLLDTKIEADLTLECQTSFEPIGYKINREVVYCAVVSEDYFADVEEEFEPVLMEDGWLDLKQVIEDELILSVPIVANKPSEELDQKMSFGELDEVAIEIEKKASNPFAVLKNLKKT
ncbi:YceD family protein [Aliikangiella coralliicola]|uniref:Large ribosomal RNA subunit accumulation protein YceD n=1 Tax=Aliikangiella coralliicola TaxID=2592383 RepID=A0A545UD45_9GAMM|nr:YceD family protein [Aliikangiella coralliicola]TQV87386.1 hypothetical protein FLL46_13140 [Aliikangiella coralliicola]